MERLSPRRRRHGGGSGGGGASATAATTAPTTATSSASIDTQATHLTAGAPLDPVISDSLFRVRPAAPPSQSPTLLVTGIAGFVGRAVAERASRLGWNVRGIDVDARGVAALKASHPEFAVLVGSVASADEVRMACEGATHVVHTAAIVNETASWADTHEVNVVGSREVARAAAAVGAEVLVHISSVAVYGMRYPHMAAEDTAVDPCGGGGVVGGGDGNGAGSQAAVLRARGGVDANAYCVTKAMAETEVMRFHRGARVSAASSAAPASSPPSLSSSAASSSGLSVCCIRPGDVYGPGSLPWVVRPVRNAQRGLSMFWGGGCMNHTYVDNLVDAVFAALSMPEVAGGQCFNVTDGGGGGGGGGGDGDDDEAGKGKGGSAGARAAAGVTTWGDYWCRLMSAAGLPPPRFVSRAAFVAGGGALGALRRIGWFDAGITGDTARFATREHPVSIAKARAVLGYRPAVALDEGMARTQRWLRSWLREHPFDAEADGVSVVYLALPALLLLALVLTAAMLSWWWARVQESVFAGEGGGGGGGGGGMWGGVDERMPMQGPGE